MTVLSVVPANRLNMNEIRSEIGSPATNLFDFKWSDHILNDIQWLRGDTFSWQSGEVYKSAYEHLVDDFNNAGNFKEETVGGIYIQYYLSPDGHKIVQYHETYPSSHQEAAEAIYNATGVAWYYILDTDNQRFKLPRTKYGFTGLRDTVGKYVAAGLPDHRHSFTYPIGDVNYSNGNGNAWWGFTNSGTVNTTYASSSNSIYGNSTTVQPPATQMYLYFYIGNYTQSAIEQTAGLNTELFNVKADADLNNASITSSFATLLNEVGIRTVVETYQNGTSWYRVYSDSWIEQGGFVSQGASTQVTLLKPLKNSNYFVSTTPNSTTEGSYEMVISAKTTTSFTIASRGGAASLSKLWMVIGQGA